MKNLISLLILLAPSFEMSAQKCEQQIYQLNTKIDSLESELIKLKKELNELKVDESDVRLWLTNNLNLIIPDDKQLNPSFDLSNYTGNLCQPIIDELKEEFWMGMYEVNEIISTEFGIIIDLGSFDLSKTLILTKDYFIVSFHTIIGDNGQALIYSFKERTSSINGEIYAWDIISPTELMVGKDYYDSRNIEDPDYEGHIFETGSYNLETGEYTFIGKE